MRGAAALLLLFSPAMMAETAVNGAGLAALEGAVDWPIVDVRELAERSGEPIPGALSFGPQLDLEGPVLVVASDERVARMTARAIETRLPAVEAFAVLDGIEGLRAIRPELLPTIRNNSMPGTFTIPSGTCQPGKPLHTYSEDE